MSRSLLALCLLSALLTASAAFAGGLTANVLDGGIAINEVLPDPAAVAINCDADSNGAPSNEEEYVELVNVSGAAIDIGGYQLWDRTATNGNWFTFPANTIVDPGGFALVMIGVQAGGVLPNVGPGSVAFDAGRTDTVMSDGGDNVVLYNPTDDEFVQIRWNGDTADSPPAEYIGFSVTATRVGTVDNFGNATDGMSISRSPDGETTLVVHGVACPTNCSPGTALCGPVPVELQTFTVN